MTAGITEDAYSFGACNTCGHPGLGGEPCGRCHAKALHELQDRINALSYCPYCGQGHAMHTVDCRLRDLLATYRPDPRPVYVARVLG